MAKNEDLKRAPAPRAVEVVQLSQTIVSFELFRLLSTFSKIQRFINVFNSLTYVDIYRIYLYFGTYIFGKDSCDMYSIWYL